MGMTFMLVSHEMRFIQQITHRVIELDDGKIICDLPTEKFFKDLNHA